MAEHGNANGQKRHEVRKAHRKPIGWRPMCLMSFQGFLAVACQHVQTVHDFQAAATTAAEMYGKTSYRKQSLQASKEERDCERAVNLTSGLERCWYLRHLFKLRRQRRRANHQEQIKAILEHPEHGGFGKKSLTEAFGSCGCPFFREGDVVIRERERMGIMLREHF